MSSINGHSEKTVGRVSSCLHFCIFGPSVRWGASELKSVPVRWRVASIGCHMESVACTPALLSVLRTVAQEAGCSSIDADEAFEILRINGVKVVQLWCVMQVCVGIEFCVWQDGSDLDGRAYSKLRLPYP